MTETPNSNASTVTESVQALYEQFPYPAALASAQPPALQGWCSYTYLYYRTMNIWRDCAERRILDAGCGTGETLWPTVLNNPRAHIIGWDLSEASLAIARKKIEAIGATEVRLEQRNLNDVAPETLPFDLIFCTGVLHHLADPLRGLRNLARCLAPDGIMALLLYATDARSEIHKMQRVLALLGGSDPLERKVQMARRLFAALPPEHPMHPSARRDDNIHAYTEPDAHMLDMFFHPHEVTYTVEQVFDLLDAAELELVRFYDEPSFDLSRLLSDPDLQRRAAFLSRRQRYQLAHLLQPRGDLRFLVRHRNARPATRPSRVAALSRIPMVSPVVARLDRTPLAPSTMIPVQSMLEVSGFSQARYHLDGDTRALLEQCDGLRTVGELAQGRDDVVTHLLALEERDIVLLRRNERPRMRTHATPPTP